MPVAASTTNTMTSASRIASRAWSWTRASMGSSGSSSRPPVSTTTNRRPFHSASPYSRSRVVRARSSTIAVRPPTIRLKSVLLPTFGRPTIATTGIPVRVPATVRRRRTRSARWSWAARSCGRPGVAAARAPPGPARGLCAGASGVPANSRMCSVTSRRSSIGVEVPPVTPTIGRLSEDRGVRQVADALDLDGRRPGDLAQARQFLRIGARAPADDDHQVHLAGQLHRVLLPSDRDRADGVHDLEFVGARDHERRQALELPGRLRGLADEGHPLPPRDGRLPLLFLVHDDRVRREAEQPDDLGVLGRPEQDDRVALLDEAAQFALLLDDPGAGPVDDLESALVGALEDVRANAVGPDDDRRAVVHIVELLDGLDTEDLQFADDTLVVDDLSEGMGGLAGGRGLLGLVDRFADAVTEPRPPGDADVLDRIHAPIIARGLRRGRSPHRRLAAPAAAGRRCDA